MPVHGYAVCRVYATQGRFPNSWHQNPSENGTNTSHAQRLHADIRHTLKTTRDSHIPLLIRVFPNEREQKTRILTISYIYKFLKVSRFRKNRVFLVRNPGISSFTKNRTLNYKTIRSCSQLTVLQGLVWESYWQVVKRVNTPLIWRRRQTMGSLGRGFKSHIHL